MPKKVAGSTKVKSEPPEDAPPPRKRASRVKGKQGALKKVMDMPVDLIYEICTHLEVGDLLALSNTNKNFRSILTGKSAPALFKSARQRMGMPELRFPMSDLRYATLFFGKGCNICGKSNGGKVDPSFRARICGACLKKEFVLHLDRRTNNLNSFTFWFTSHRTFAKNGQEGLYYLPELERISNEIDTKFPVTRSEVRSAIRLSCLYKEFECEEEAVASGIKITDEVIEIAKSYDEFFSKLVHAPEDETIIPEGEFQTLLLERVQERKLLRKDAETLQEWLQEMEIKKAEAAQKLRLGRRKDIENRLEALGFEKSEFEVSEFVNHPQVKANRPLSDRTFSTTVEPPLRQILEAKRRDHRRFILQDKYRFTINHHAEKDYFPPTSIYLELPILQPLLDDVSRNPDESDILSESVKSIITQQISKLIRDRREHLLRSIVLAYLDLSQQEKNHQENKNKVGKAKLLGGKGKKKEEADVKDYSVLTSIVKLPFTLPRLPPWIPRSQDDPILASDEQLVSFLENSPLANFECTSCRGLFSLPSLLSHQRSRRDCDNMYEWISNEVQHEWITIEGLDDVEKPKIRIDKDVLSLSLKLQQLAESIPHVVVKKSEKLPDLGPKYSLGEEKPDWFQVSLICKCDVYHVDPYTFKEMYQHIVKSQEPQHRQSCDRIKAVVSYSSKLRARWRTLRDRKHRETDEFIEDPHGDDDEPSVRRLGGRLPSYIEKDGDEGCVVS